MNKSRKVLSSVLGPGTFHILKTDLSVDQLVRYENREASLLLDVSPRIGSIILEVISIYIKLDIQF